MKIRVLMALFLVVFMTLLPVACKSTEVVITPPSPEVLAQEGFAFPEMPRITCEQLKQMMDEGEDIVLVDTRVTLVYDLGHLPEAINIPMEPEELATVKLQTLPTDKLIAFYCD